MKTLLVDPPGNNKGLNVGLGYLAAVLKQQGISTLVLDLNNVHMGPFGDPNQEMLPSEMENRLIQAIKDFSPEIIGFSVKTFTASICARLASLARFLTPQTTIIVGGIHVTLDGEEYLRQNPAIDIGFLGEAEGSLIEVIQALAGKRKLENVAGIVFRKDNSIQVNQRRPYLKELDSLPLPDYSVFTSILAQDGHMDEYPILTSRGCPYKCTYCTMFNVMGRAWRARGPEEVVQELQAAQNAYGINSFTVIDDNLTFHLERTERICDLLIENGSKLPWNSQNGIRADRLNEKLTKKMRESGCQHVWIGIESADEAVFNAINKGETLADIRRGIISLKSAGIKVGGFFIVGLPHSTRKTDLKSVEFAKQMGIDGWWFMFIPYPFTESWDWVKENGKILRPLEGALQYGRKSIEPVFETSAYLASERAATYREIHIRMGYINRLIDPTKGKIANGILILGSLLRHRPTALGEFLLLAGRKSLNILRKRVVRQPEKSIATHSTH